MMRQRKAVGRRKFWMIIMHISLCLDFTAATSHGVSNDFHRNKKSFSNFDTMNSNKNSKVNEEENLSKSLTRKSRELTDEGGLDFNIEEEMEKFGSPQNKREKSTLIPSLRVGRSGKFDVHSIMPYPDSWVVRYFDNAQDKSNVSPESIKGKIGNYEQILSDTAKYTDDDIGIASEDTRYPVETLEASLNTNSSINERQVDDNGTVIPYPRFGKRDDSNVSSGRKKRTSESLIPQIRYGRSAKPDKSTKIPMQPFYILPNYRPGRSVDNSLDSFKFYKQSKQGLLPYPRPGRSNFEIEKRPDYMLPVARFGRSMNGIANFDQDELEILTKLGESTLDDAPKELDEGLMKSKDSPIFLIPYPRPGKRFFGTKPLPPNVKPEFKDKEAVLQDSKEKEPSSTIFLVPYPRPGRSNTEKVGSDFIIPYARLGKSVPNSMVPYPRLGRSEHENNQYFMLPYPRAGRSQRSTSLIPYARLGRSYNNILPYPRLGRAHNSILPYPRLGRSNKFSKSGSSVSAYVLPYPRIGRDAMSGSIIPQIRVGKSSNSQESLNNDIKDNDQTEDEEDYDRGENSNKVDSEFYNPDSEKVKSALLVPAKKLHKHVTNYMLPYPRPGRVV